MVGCSDPKNIFDALRLGRAGPKRSVRVADAIRKELAMLILTKVCDPKLTGVGISRVEVSDDLQNAKIYFTVIGDHKVVRSAAERLERAKGFMRTHLARSMNMRYTPTLQFKHDEVAEKVERLDSVFQEIADERGHGGGNS